VVDGEDMMSDLSCACSSPISASCKRSLDSNVESTLPGETSLGGRLGDLVGEALKIGMSQMVLPVNV